MGHDSLASTPHRYDETLVGQGQGLDRLSVHWRARENVEFQEAGARQAAQLKLFAALLSFHAAHDRRLIGADDILTAENADQVLGIVAVDYGQTP